MPSDRRWSDAELEAAALAAQAAGPYTGPVDYARAVLAAVAPLIAARVRAETAEEIALDLLSVAGRPGGLWAAVIARAHRTTPEADHGDH